MLVWFMVVVVVVVEIVVMMIDTMTRKRIIVVVRVMNVRWSRWIHGIMVVVVRMITQ